MQFRKDPNWVLARLARLASLVPGLESFPVSKVEDIRLQVDHRTDFGPQQPFTGMSINGFAHDHSHRCDYRDHHSARCQSSLILLQTSSALRTMLQQLLRRIDGLCMEWRDSPRICVVHGADDDCARLGWLLPAPNLADAIVVGGGYSKLLP